MSAAYATPAPAASFESSREQFEQITGFLSSTEAMQLSHAALEEHLTREGRELQRRLLQEHLDLRTAAERRLKQVDGSDGASRTEVSVHAYRLERSQEGNEKERLKWQLSMETAQG